MNKRLFNILILIPLSIFLIPCLILIYLISLFVMGFPVIFKQDRPGVNGIPFKFYKFRTMTNKIDNNSNLLSDEKRLTKFGIFLRKTSLDELPSFLNVLKGDMNLVGPRPLLIKYLDRYTPEQLRRNEVKPGVTGWAQVNGRNAVSWEEKFKYDIWYIDNKSLWLDFKILFLTIWSVLRSKGISNFGYATMPEFTGNKGNKSSNETNPK